MINVIITTRPINAAMHGLTYPMEKQFYSRKDIDTLDKVCI